MKTFQIFPEESSLRLFAYLLDTWPGRTQKGYARELHIVQNQTPWDYPAAESSLFVRLPLQVIYLEIDLQYYITIIILSLITLSENLIQHCLLSHIALKFCDRYEIGQTKI